MMNRSTKLGVLAILLAVAPAARAAQINADAGTSGASFLKLGAGARAGAMADANAALADDVYALYYNPAGLTQLTGPQIAGAHGPFRRDELRGLPVRLSLRAGEEYSAMS